jgi:Fe-S-cluster containining protein
VSLDDHQLDEDGLHDPEECEACLEAGCSVGPTCGCGRCCEALLIEATPRDALREPRIAECGPILCGVGGTREVVGYLLNDRENGGACRFFDRASRRCGIYDTRPLACRLFDCRDYEHQDSGCS